MDAKPVSRNMSVRMDLPFVGLATFTGQPACTDWDKLDGADVAILGIPIDTASSYRVGTRFGRARSAKHRCSMALVRKASSISRTR
jgi:agmatinase